MFTMTFKKRSTVLQRLIADTYATNANTADKRIAWRTYAKVQHWFKQQHMY
jgi:hypothetical protein